MAEWIRDTGLVLHGANRYGELLDGECGTRASHAMSPDEEALTWAFGMLLRTARPHGQESRFRFRGIRTGIPVWGGMSRRLLDRMGWAAERSAPVRESLDRMQSLLATADMSSLLDVVSDPRETGFALAQGFETLLARWNRSLRRRLGVYFTPRPLAEYIVRGVDTLLREELSVGDGLATADTPLTIIDPACGSGVFLLSVVEHVRRTVGLAGTPRRSNQVRQSLADQLIGMDVMPACCVAVELLMERTLATDWSACCGSPLEQVEFSRSLFTHGTSLEGRPADSNPQRKRSSARSQPPRSDPSCIPVVIGNPPYGSFGRRNRGSWIREQLRDYKSGLDEKKLNLDDDFVKFLRWAQFWIEQAGRGVLAMVTSNTYLSGLTHRRMRASLAGTFDRIHILDLHGSLKKRERTPAGAADQNVFPIQQGVCVGLFVKSGRDRRNLGGKIYHGELWGTRDEKLAMLAEASIDDWPWTPLEPGEAMHYFVPRADADPGPYRRWPRLDQIFRHYVSGIQTKRDSLFVALPRRTGRSYAGIPARGAVWPVSRRRAALAAGQGRRRAVRSNPDPTVSGRTL